MSKVNTDFETVKSLAEAGHQIGMTSLDGRIPQDGDQWLSNYKGRQLTQTFMCMCLCRFVKFARYIYYGMLTLVLIWANLNIDLF